jgi:hypothetical protein
MAQIGRPASTITNQWTITDTTAHGATSDQSDSTYIIASDSAAEGYECELKLDSLTDPSDNTNHSVYLRWQVSGGGGGPEKIDLRLMQGATEIALWANQAAPDTTTEQQFVVAEANAANITDYTDLRIEIVVDTLGNNEDLIVYEAWISIPDAVSQDVNVDCTVVNLTLTEYGSTVNAENNVQAGVNSLTLSEQSASVTLDVVVSAGVDSLSLTEQSASIKADINVSAALAALSLVEQAANVSLGVVVSAGLASLTLSELTASIGVDTNVSAALVALALAGQTAVINAAINVGAGYDALTLVERNATVDVGESGVPDWVKHKVRKGTLLKVF